MPKERFFCSGPLVAQTEVVLTDQELHHLFHVMRMEEGEEVELVNGEGILAKGFIRALKKKEAQISLESITQAEKPATQLILYQAIPRIQRLDFIVEKGTELGMTHLYLFPGEKSERKDLTPKQLQGLVEQAIAALKQCGRLWVPTITLLSPIPSWSTLAPSTFIADLHATEHLRPQNHSSAICIGPEAGFSDRELAHLKHLGALPRLLHANILRTDTAALAALTILSLGEV